MSTTDSKPTIEKDEKKAPGFFSKFILLGILPLFYSIGLGMVILHLSGVDFKTQVKWIEDHTKPLFAKKQETAKAKSAETKTTSAAADAETKATATAPATNTGDTEVSTDTAGSTEDMSAAENNQAADQNADESTETSVVAESLANMDPKDAAKMLSNMTEEQAAKNLKNLDRDVQTAIIAEMSPEEGAMMAKALEDGYQADTTTDSSLQLYQYMTPDQIASVLKGISDRNEVLRQIKQLDPKTASKVMAKLNSELSGWIVSHMR